jgi:C4-type Zn-finger protein
MKETENEFMTCPHCNNEIEYLQYISEVQERGTIGISINEDGEVEQGDMDCDDTDTTQTDTECPQCGRTLSTENVIIKNPKKKSNTETYKFSIGKTPDKITEIIKEIRSKDILMELKEGKHKGLILSFKPKEITPIDLSKEIDNGDSETTDKVIHKKEEETFKIDPLFKQGSICPKCKHFFAEEKELKITLEKNKYPLFNNEEEISQDTSTCPKCKHEFNRIEQYMKLITK